VNQSLYWSSRVVAWNSASYDLVIKGRLKPLSNVHVVMEQGKTLLLMYKCCMLQFIA